MRLETSIQEATAEHSKSTHYIENPIDFSLQDIYHFNLRGKPSLWHYPSFNSTVYKLGPQKTKKNLIHVMKYIVKYNNQQTTWKHEADHKKLGPDLN